MHKILSRDLSQKLQRLGFDEETEHVSYEPESILQIDTGSCGWTPSKDIAVKCPTVGQALSWLTKRADDKTLRLSENLHVLDKLKFILYSMK